MIAYIFAGQGSQFRGMGAEVFGAFPDLVDRADDILGYSIEELCLTDPDQRLNRTEYTQPAVYVVNALSHMREARNGSGVADYYAGHSLGEYNALLAAGAFSFEDGLRMVAKRGELMGSVSYGGGMAAVVGLSADDILDALSEAGLYGVDLANFNTPTQVVISGSTQDIAMAQSVFENLGASYHILSVGGAFHSRFMAPARAAFEDFVEPFYFHTLHTPVISNRRALPYLNGSVAVDLVEQITAPVRWVESIAYMARQGVTEWKEVAPRAILTPFLRKIIKSETSKQ
ncbi:[acyl-carrier-protein] S-malonyltransferase [Chromobacterium sp. ATCC 53434]|uniref:ACP S-malonyltransferase n=1 Tax=Chromobacterium TaxID=535 RepID=UPI000C7772BB|nr:ACP S-malonyltransferase [Chromobacterium sp. ATCC 53434]AUH52217.1 [acyl-carrier-protein] S-malonyltransferase [Chromobacterium sp. ATCC 53434]